MRHSDSIAWQQHFSGTAEAIWDNREAKPPVLGVFPVGVYTAQAEVRWA
jgi:hypothetical protein